MEKEETVIGRGGYGVVYKKRKDPDVVVKKAYNDDLSQQEIKREAFKHQYLKKRKTLAKSYVPALSVNTVKNKIEYPRMQKTVQKDMDEFREKPDLYLIEDKNRARKIVRGSLKAARNLHKQGFVHRDLHTENIMINDKGKVKLIDPSSLVGENAEISNISTQTEANNLLYELAKVYYKDPKVKKAFQRIGYAPDQIRNIPNSIIGKVTEKLLYELLPKDKRKLKKLVEEIQNPKKQTRKPSTTKKKRFREIGVNFDKFEETGSKKLKHSKKAMKGKIEIKSK